MKLSTAVEIVMVVVACCLFRWVEEGQKRRAWLFQLLFGTVTTTHCSVYVFRRSTGFHNPFQRVPTNSEPGAVLNKKGDTDSPL